MLWYQVTNKKPVEKKNNDLGATIQKFYQEVALLHVN